VRRFLLVLAALATVLTPGSAQAEAQIALSEQVSHLITQAASHTQQPHLPDVPSVPADNRPRAVDALLAKYHSPLRGLGRQFVVDADRDGYDWRLLVAISGVESGFGRDEYGHNPFGWGGGRIPFTTFSAAIETVSSQLGARYVRSGLTTPWEIQRIYDPSSGTWASRVAGFMAQLHV
jgi:hypothetical protein